VTDPLRSLDAQLRFAIANKRLIEVRYQGHTRVAEPHDYGARHGVDRLLVYQLRGPVRPGRSAAGWRRFDTEKIEACTVLDDVFKGSRGQSHHDHLEWDVLYARVT
jgi:hypothetical protein